MRRTNAALFFCLALSGVLLAPSCATVMGRTELIPVTSSPAFATVSVNGQRRGQTPLNVRLARNNRKQVIRIEAPGYDPCEIRIKHVMKGSYLLGYVPIGVAFGSVMAYCKAIGDDDANFWGLLAKYSVLGAMAPFMVDVISGKGFALRPKELAVTLTKANGTARVDTMLVDADEFRNVKWIRVRLDKAPARARS